MLKQGCWDIVTNRNGDNLTQDLIFRPYRPRDEEKIVELLELVGQSQIAVCLNNDEMIGCAHLLPLRLKVGDEVYSSCYGTDVAVHPEYRGYGICNRLNSLRHDLATKAGYFYSFHPTRNPLLLRHHRRYWQTFPHDILNFVKIHDIDRQLEAMPMKNRWLMKYGFLGARHLNSFINTFRVQGSGTYQGRILSIKAFNDKINNFWEETSDQYDFVVERSSGYLNWRYSYSRSGEFIILQAEEEDVIKGYTVLSVNRKLGDYPVGFIMDLISLPDRRDVVHALVMKALKEFDKQGVNLVNCLVAKKHPYEEIFSSSGLLDSRVKFELFYYILETTKKNVLEDATVGKVHFSWGDHDTLPVKGH